MNHFHFMTIDGKSSKDFDMYISGAGTYSAPEPSFKEVEIPGRNGIMYLYDGKYKNIEVKYSAWIEKLGDPLSLEKQFKDLRSFLLSRNGYVRIEDTYHPSEFRFGAYNSKIEPDVHDSLEVLSFDLKFNCKPQRYLKKYYDFPLTIESSPVTFFNETYFEAKPLLRVYGSGSFVINGTTVGVTNESTSSYTDIDCELQEAYRNTLATNRNSYVTLTNAKFPTLKPGENTITKTGITKILVYPRLFNI